MQEKYTIPTLITSL